MEQLKLKYEEWKDWEINWERSRKKGVRPDSRAFTGNCY